MHNSTDAFAAFGSVVTTAIGSVQPAGTAAWSDAVHHPHTAYATSGTAPVTDGSGSQTLVVSAGGTAELASPFSGTVSFAGSTGTLTIDDSSTFSGTITGQLGIGQYIDLRDVTAGGDATITYSGNNSPGTLTVSDGTHTATIALDGVYSLANFTVSSDGHGGTLLVDPPVAPVISSFSTDSGVVGDHITNDSTLTLTGTAAANTAVKVYDGTTLLGSTTANASGAWSYTTGTLSDGTHSFTAATTDTSGGTGSPPSGFPDASTTGVRDGVTLKSAGGQFSSSSAGQVIEGITADLLVINDPNVVIRDCKVGSIIVNAPNCTIEYTDVVGKNSLNSVDIEGANATIRYCDISGSENGIWLEADGCVIQDNYIHNLFSNTGSSDPHIDGIQIPGHNIGAVPTENATISHNNIDLDVRTANSTITMMDGINIDISNNRLNGGAYVIYFEGDSRGCDVVNNVFAQYTFGYVTGQSETSQTYTGNVTSQNVPLVQSVLQQDLVPGTGTVLAAPTAETTVTSAPLSVTIDTVAPSAPTIAASTPTSAHVEVLTGTAEANSTVKVFDGTAQIGTAIANASGGWSYTTAALLTGSHSFTATAMDAAGNTGAASAVAAVDITTSNPAPSAPTITSFSSDSGVAEDGITNDNTLELHGTAAADSTITIYDGSNEIGVATADAAGSWDYITSVLTNATHVLTATATDAGGQTSSKSAALSVTVDTVAPASPVVGSNAVINTDHVKLSGTAEANSTVTVHDGATVVGTVTASSTGAWTVTTSALSDGTHTLTATATDVAGNVSAASQSVEAVIGTTPPVAPTIAELSIDSGASASDHITNDNTPTLTGTADAGTSVKVFDGSEQVGSATADSSGQWSVTTSLLGDGAHNLTATATDAAGQTSATSAALSVTIDTEVNAPVISSSTAAGSDAYLLKGTVEANSTVSVFDGAEQVGTAKADASGAWSFTVSSLSVGTHSLTATAVDVAGNSSGASEAVSAVISAPPLASPTIVSFVDSGIPGDHITNDSALTLTGTAAANTTVRMFDGADQVGSTKVDSSGHWTLTTLTLSDGAHDLTATSTDSSGLVSAPSAVLPVTIDTLVSRPTMELYSESGEAVGATTTLDDLIIKGMAEANSKVAVFDGGDQIGTATADSKGAWSYDTGHLADGSHNFTANATDIAGNTSTSSTTKSVMVDAHVAPLEFTDVYQTSDHGITIKGTADAFSQIKLLDGTETIATVTADSHGAWTFNSSCLSDQVHTFKAQEVDKDGHVLATSTDTAILGSSGPNTLTSTAGDDTFIGKGHPDAFMFAANFGNDVIKDFVACGSKHDTIQFSKSVFDSFASVLSHASQAGQDVVIAVGNDSLTLKNTKLGALNSHDFHFA